MSYLLVTITLTSLLVQPAIVLGYSTHTTVEMVNAYLTRLAVELDFLSDHVTWPLGSSRLGMNER